ncbi:hypothetical protein I553_5768 [Mycobacterium xenopi 4042]|uniref:Uncharacterized protein n=1 Tax=Mycobacterium xenopi 4042 TaxID=1299334 RepID=X7ZW54_MYCXE|nr:hypothetical protein I553_5768 [Mycobacterium xenopi 4042]
MSALRCRAVGSDGADMVDAACSGTQVAARTAPAKPRGAVVR